MRPAAAAAAAALLLAATLGAAAAGPASERLCGEAAAEGGAYACLGVQGRLSSRFVQAREVHVDDQGGFARVQGDSLVRGAAAVRELAAAEEAAVENLSARAIRAPPGKAGVRLAARLQVNGRVVYGEGQAPPPGTDDKERAAPRPLGGVPADQAVAFLEEAVSVVSHAAEGGDASPGAERSVRQWRLAAHDAFAGGDADGWTAGGAAGRERSAPRSQSCQEGGHAFLATSRRGADAELPELAKRFGPLPPHTHLELTARVHLVDAWRGGTAYLKLDGGLAWLEQHGADDGEEAAPEGISLCGSAYPGDRLSVPVKVIVPHSADHVDVAFGGLFAGPAAADGHAAVLGLDDVAVLVN